MVQQPLPSRRPTPERGGQRAARWVAALAAAGTVLAMPFHQPSVAYAATITVTTTADDTTDPTVLSLREAISNAVTGDEIVLPAGSYTLTDMISSGGGDDNTGGDLDVFGKNITITGAGAATTIIQQTVANQRVLQLLAGAGLDISGVTITGGTPTVGTSGGGITNAGALTVTLSTITGNRVANSTGGGIATTSAAATTVISGSSILSNSVVITGTSIAGGGGGLSNAGTTNVFNSAVLSNTAELVGTPAMSSAVGGGISSTGGTITIANTTVVGNSTTGSGGGVAVTGTSGANAFLIQDTLTGNIADTDNVGGGGGGGVFEGTNGTVELRNTLVALNVDLSTGTPDVEGGFGTSNNNLLGNGTGATGFIGNGNQVGTNATPINPGLAALGNYGGPTLSRGLLASSPARDAADLGQCSRSEVGGRDQRGQPRPFGSACDIGAFEAQVSQVVVDSGGTTVASGASVNFGTTPVGTPVTRSFTISNTGDLDLSVGGVAAPAGYTAAFTGTNVTLAAGGTATLTATLTAASASTFAGTLSFTSTALGATPFTLSLNGTVSAAPTAPEIAVFQGTTEIANGGIFDFGTTPVGTPLTRTFTITNSGDAALTLTAPSSTPTGVTVVGTFPTSVAPTSSASFTLRLDAVAPATISDTLSFGTDDADENPFTISLRGSVVSATAPAEITLLNGTTEITSGGSLAFGTTLLGTPVSRTLTVRNTGGLSLTLGAFTAPTGFTATGPLSTSLGSGQETTITLRLNAAAAGTFTGTFSLANSDSNENPYLINASGTVTTSAAPAISLFQGTSPVGSGGSVDFGNIVAGSTVTKSFTISNTGTTTLTLQAPATLPSGFSLVGAFPSSVAPNGSATFTLQATTATSGMLSGTVAFGTNATPSTFTFTVTAVGVRRGLFLPIILR